MHWLVDLDRAVGEGLVGPESAVALKARARDEAVRLALNLVLMGGILAVLLGVFALFDGPEGLAVTGALVALAGIGVRLNVGEGAAVPANAAVVIGAGSGAGGAVGLIAEQTGSLGPAIALGSAIALLGVALRLRVPRLATPAAWIVVIGAGAHLTGVFGLEGAPELAWVALAWAGVVLGATGAFLDIRLLSALAVVAFAATLSDTGYSHASYSLAVYEPTLVILMMAAIGAGAYALSGRTERIARHARIVGLMAFVWGNIAFWVGSLWGDRIGSEILGPRRSAFPDTDAGWTAYHAAGEAHLARLVEIPDTAFAILWAVLLVATALWAGLTARRSIMNAAVTFGAIHLYTQWLERFDASPGSIILAGISAILAAWGVRELNRRLPAR
ncbi:MAG: hypothetical protein ACFBSD_14820 [Paracoccaceae bacterium]